MPDLPEQLNKLLERVEQEKCPKAHEGHDGYLDGSCNGEPCHYCHGTGLNPAYAGILEVVREEKSGRYLKSYFITRSWEGMPPTSKALEGSLYHAAFNLWNPSTRNSPWGPCAFTLMRYLREPGDTREAAVLAVLEAMEGHNGQ